MLMPVLGRAAVIHRLPKHGVGAEVGVWEGGYSGELLRVASPKVLHLIDPWQTAGGEKATAWYGTANKSQADMDAMYDRVRKKFAKAIAEEQVIVHRSPSTEALASLSDNALDWIYVDGDHSFDGALADLRSSYAKVRVGGIIAGDDYGRSGEWYQDGLVLALHQFLHETAGKVRIDLVMEAQFVLVKQR